MSWLLGLDGATEQITLALVRTDGTAAVGRSLAGGAQASAHLVPAILDLMAAHGVAPATLSAVGFGQGPGAFTSLRAICAATQGLAEGWQRPVMAVDSLLLTVDDAAGPSPTPGLWAAVMDARMGEVYAASYRRDASGWTAELSPSLWTPAALAAHWALQPPQHLSGSGVTMLGAGWTAIAGACRWAALARQLVTAWSHGRAQDAAQAQPLYVRDRVALTTDERAAARAAVGA